MAPDWVTWNGYAGQYVKHPLTANPGETVRFWVVAAGPSFDTDFHVVGTLLNRAWIDGDMTQYLHNVQTATVPAGGGGVFDVKIDEDGPLPIRLALVRERGHGPGRPAEGRRRRRHDEPLVRSPPVRPRAAPGARPSAFEERASGVLAERVARRGVGSGARAAAEVGVLARAAAAVEVGGADLAQQRAVPVEVDKALLADVAQRERQEARRVDLAVVGDEDDPLAVARALRLRPGAAARLAEEGREPCRRGARTAPRGVRRAPPPARRRRAGRTAPRPCARRSRSGRRPRESGRRPRSPPARARPGRRRGRRGRGRRPPRSARRRSRRARRSPPAPRRSRAGRPCSPER